MIIILIIIIITHSYILHLDLHLTWSLASRLGEVRLQSSSSNVALVIGGREVDSDSRTRHTEELIL